MAEIIAEWRPSLASVRRVERSLLEILDLLFRFRQELRPRTRVRLQLSVHENREKEIVVRDVEPRSAVAAAVGGREDDRLRYAPFEDAVRHDRRLDLRDAVFDIDHIELRH